MYYDGKVHIEEEDQCASCKHYLKGVSCPLLEALAVGVASLEGDVLVKNCGFYIEFKRHLRVVESEAIDAVGEDLQPPIETDASKDTQSQRFN